MDLCKLSITYDYLDAEAYSSLCSPKLRDLGLFSSGNAPLKKSVLYLREGEQHRIKTHAPHLSYMAVAGCDFVRVYLREFGVTHLLERDFINVPVTEEYALLFLMGDVPLPSVAVEDKRTFREVLTDSGYSPVAE